MTREEQKAWDRMTAGAWTMVRPLTREQQEAWDGTMAGAQENLTRVMTQLRRVIRRTLRDLADWAVKYEASSKHRGTSPS